MGCDREAVILGVVEGITEYLPISSTGHLILTNAWLGIDGDVPLNDSESNQVLMTDGVPITAKNAADAYAIIIRAGAILAVLVLYWSNVWQMLLGVLGLNPTGKRLARNLKLGTGSRLLPEIAMAHYDWLHGYDPVGRFG